MGVLNLPILYLRGLLSDVDNKSQPKVIRYFGVVQHGSDPLLDSMIHSFHIAIFLQIMGSCAFPSNVNVLSIEKDKFI